MLEHDVDVVGILGEAHGIYMCALGRGEVLCVEAAVVEIVETVVDTAAVGAPGAGDVGLAGAETALQAGLDVGVGHAEVGAVALAAPCHQGVGARLHLDIHHVAGSREGLAALVAGEHHPARAVVDHVERDGAHLAGKGVGKLHVAVVDKPHLVVRVAVALTVVDEAVARGQADGGDYGGDRGEDMSVDAVFHICGEIGRAHV